MAPEIEYHQPLISIAELNYGQCGYVRPSDIHVDFDRKVYIDKFALYSLEPSTAYSVLIYREQDNSFTVTLDSSDPNDKFSLERLSELSLYFWAISIVEAQTSQKTSILPESLDADVVIFMKENDCYFVQPYEIVIDTYGRLWISEQCPIIDSPTVDGLVAIVKKNGQFLAILGKRLENFNQDDFFDLPKESDGYVLLTPLTLNELDMFFPDDEGAVVVGRPEIPNTQKEETFTANSLSEGKQYFFSPEFIRICNNGRTYTFNKQLNFYSTKPESGSFVAVTKQGNKLFVDIAQLSATKSFNKLGSFDEVNKLIQQGELIEIMFMHDGKLMQTSPPPTNSISLN